MNMNSIQRITGYAPTAVKKQETAKTQETTPEKVETAVVQNPQDSFVSSQKTTETEEVKTNTYEKPSKLSADQLQALSDQRLASFKSMLQTMLGKQVTTLNKSLFEGISISAADQQAAAEAIAPGGAWSPETVANNILNMAKALSGGDVSKLELLKDAVNKGFAEAEKEWGGSLPSITDETYDLVMKGFDDWAKEAKGTEQTTQTDAE